MKTKTLKGTNPSARGVLEDDFVVVTGTGTACDLIRLLMDSGPLRHHFSYNPFKWA
jgi:hypothetical protein